MADSRFLEKKLVRARVANIKKISTRLRVDHKTNVVKRGASFGGDS